MNYEYSLKEDVFEEDATDADKEEKSVKPKLLERMEFFNSTQYTDEQLKNADFGKFRKEDEF